MAITRTLCKTVIKSGASEYHAFLIAPQPTAHATMGFFYMTTMARRHFFLAQDLHTELLSRLAVEPIQYAHAGYVVACVSRIIQFVILLATDTKATIPIDLDLVPGGIAKDIFIRRHVG